MENYLLKYINNINTNLWTHKIKYTIKGSLCLYLHYLLSSDIKINSHDFSKPADIDIDVFYIITNKFKLDDNTTICSNAVNSVIKCFFNDNNDTIASIASIMKRIQISFTNKEEVTVYEKNNAKINVMFESLNKKVFFGEIVDGPYYRIVLKYYDENDNNYIDFFMDCVNENQFILADTYIKSIYYKDVLIHILTFDNIISRYNALYTNPSIDRLNKMPSDIKRFNVFYESTTNEYYRGELEKLINKLKELQKGGGIKKEYYKKIYTKYKYMYLFLKNQ